MPVGEPQRIEHALGVMPEFEIVVVMEACERAIEVMTCVVEQLKDPITDMRAHWALV